MARPRTPIGAYGDIGSKEIRPGVWEAWTLFRFRNGASRQVRRRGLSKTQAINKLKDALTTLVNETVRKKINPDTRMAHVMDLWLEDFAVKVRRGKRAEKSLYEYRSAITVYLRPKLGDLSCREAENAGLCDETLKEIIDEAGRSKRGKSGTAAAKRCRTVLSGVCGYAVRHGAMATNPVKSAEAIEQPTGGEIRALEPEDRKDFLAKFRAHVERHVADNSTRLGVRARAWTDLPDLIEAMLATGTRPGETLAIESGDVDPANRIVRVGHHLVRVEKVGMVRKANRKGNRPGLKLTVPEWSVPMWRRRKLAAGGKPIFASWLGTWEDPSNVGRRIKEVCTAIGYEWVTARLMRSTVGSHLGDSNLSNEQIADQLGNTPDVVQKHYRRKKTANEKIAGALETMWDAGNE